MEKKEEEEEEVFEDAQETASMSMEESLRHVVYLVNKYTQHQFHEVRETCAELSTKYLLHAFGLSLFDIIEAYLCLDEDHVNRAITSVKHCVEFSDSQRCKNSMFKTYHEYTESELLAEVVYIFAQLLECAVLMLQDPSMVALIGRGLKIKYFYGVIKSLKEINKTFHWKSQYVKDNVDICLKLMFGIFSLILSVFPNRLIRFFNFIGFDTSEEVGLRELQDGIDNENNGFLVVFLAISLLHRSCFIPVFSYNIRDLSICKHLLEIQLKKYPKFFLTFFIEGRFELLSGNFELATEKYMSSWKCQTVYPQLHSLCYWELLFTSLINRKYTNALDYINKLLETTRWSLTWFHYYKAVIMLKLNFTREQVLEEMKLVPIHKKKMMFRTAYNEKILIHRANRYINKNQLFLPDLELLFTYNFFKIIGTNTTVAQDWLKIIEKELRIIQDGELADDFKAAAHFYKGILLRFLDAPLQSEDNFKSVIKLENRLKEDHYLIPFCYFELAILEKTQKNYSDALIYLDKMKKYSGYTRRHTLQYSTRWLKKDIVAEQNVVTSL